MTTSASTRRLLAVDLARGVALLGMMLSHLGPSRLPMEWPPVADLLVDGRAAPLFAVLAGLSVGLMSRFDPRGMGSAPSIVVRALLLLLIGLGLAALPNLLILVILPCYALLLVLVLPLRSLSTRWLFAVAAAWAVVGPVLLLFLRRRIDPPILEHNYQASLLHDLGDVPLEVLLWGGYPAVIWFAYVVLGLALSRLDLADLRTGASLVGVGAVLTAGSLAVGVLVIFRDTFIDVLGPPEVHQVFTPGRRFDELDTSVLLTAGPHAAGPLAVVGAAGSAMLVLGLCVLVCRGVAGTTLTAPFRAAGSMTLTLYVLHVVLTWLGDEHELTITDGTYLEWLAQGLALVVLATLWRAVLPRGPLEQVVRTVSLLPARRTPRSRGDRGVQ